MELYPNSLLKITAAVRPEGHEPQLINTIFILFYDNNSAIPYCCYALSQTTQVKSNFRTGWLASSGVISKLTINLWVVDKTSLCVLIV